VSGVVVVFAKAPVPGRVKTRLCPPLSHEQAAAFYACMLDDVLETTAAAAESLGLEAVLAVDPPEARAALVRRVPPAYRVVAQHGRDLAARMARSVAEHAAGGLRPILLRGSDSPALPASLLADAVAALASGADAVLSSDADGGYSLVGLNRPASGLFSHPMSHAGVLDQTVSRAEQAGLRVHLLEPCFDLDTEADLVRLAEWRRIGRPLQCPRTLGWLDRYRAWPGAAA
jgi:rSAM/selenodomain-associated transferase 1